MATSSNASATAGGASTNASGSTGSASTVDIKAPLWAYVNILEKPKTGGGNVLWKCKYCSMEKFTSYTRVEARCRNQEGELSSCSEESWADCSSIDEFGDQID